MIIVKLSHSIISTWAGRHYEDAVSYYLGRDVPATPQMELGSLNHDLWATHIMKHGTIPKELGGGKLTSPVVEQKYEKLIPLGKYGILLRGKPDMTDLPICWEWKCGMGEPTTYVDSLQLDYYKLLIPELEVGIYRCYNPYTKTFKTGVKYLTDWNAEQALNHIITFGGELIEYLETQRMIKNYHPEIYNDPKYLETAYVS